MGTVFKRGGQNNRGGSYYVSWFDHTRKRWTKCLKTTDKATAERVAAKLDADAALRRDGVIDPTLDSIGRESKRSIEDHLKDFTAKLRAAHRSDDYVHRTAQFIQRIAEAAEFGTPADIGADGVNHFAAAFRAKGRSSRSIQAHLTAIKGFTRWLTEHHKLPRDPLASIRRPSPKTDRRRIRRMLLPEEWNWLRPLAFGENVKDYGMAATERLLLFETAIQTGLRSTELRSLRVCQTTRF